MRKTGRNWLFRSATARAPTAAEDARLRIAHEAFLQFYTTDVEAARQALSVGASKAPEAVDPAALAALTALANTILNLDETTSRE